MADFIESNLLYPTAPSENYVYKTKSEGHKTKKEKRSEMLKPSVKHSFPSFSIKGGKYTSKTYRSLSFQNDTESKNILGSLVSIQESDDQTKQTKPFYKKRLKSKSKTLKLLKFEAVVNLLTSIRDKISPKDSEEENLIFGLEETEKKENQSRKKRRHKNKDKAKKKSRKKKLKKVTSKSCKIVTKCLFSMTTMPNYYLSGPVVVSANYDKENIYQVTKKP